MVQDYQQFFFIHLITAILKKSSVCKFHSLLYFTWKTFLGTLINDVRNFTCSAILFCSIDSVILSFSLQQSHRQSNDQSMSYLHPHTSSPPLLYLLSSALSLAITASSNLIISVVPLCQWTVTLAGKPLWVRMASTIASCEGCAVQGAVLLRDRDICVDEGIFFYDVEGLVVVVGLLQLVCLLAKQSPTHGYLWNTKQTTEAYTVGGASQ